MNQQWDTIVVGSGIAGSAAANELAKAGHKVLILEAEDYVGGRAKSTNIKLPNNETMTYDWGQTWIDIAKQNSPIVKIAQELKSDMTQTNFNRTICFNEEGKLISEDVDEEYQKFEEVIEELDDYKDKTLYEALLDIDEDKLKDPIFMYILSTELEFQNSCDMKKISAIECVSDDIGINTEEYDSGMQMFLTTGNQPIVQHLTKHANVEVKLKHGVNKIKRHQTQDYSTITCDNGSVFQGKNVVIAVPLGVLQKERIKFEPNCNEKKCTAMDEIWIGNICKVLIVFKNGYVNPKHRKQCGYDLICNDVEKRGFATFYINMFAVDKKPCLITYGIGENADEMENMPEQELKEILAKKIAIIAKRPVNTEQFDIFRSNWGTNPNFLGAGSYAGIDTEDNDWKEVARPEFDKKWFFAGEHTHKYHGTFEGAHQSGLDAAKVIIDNVTEENWHYDFWTDEWKEEEEAEKKEAQKLEAQKKKQ